MTIEGVSAGGIQHIGEGKFLYDGKEMSFEDVAFMVQIEVINRVDEQFTAKFNEVRERNTKIKDINDMMGTMRKYMSHFDKDGNYTDDSTRYGDDGKKGKLTHHDAVEWVDFYNKYIKTGIIEDSGLGWTFDKKEIEGFIENAKSSISNLNAENELDMMQLNRLGNQRNSYMQLLKSLLQKVSQARSEAARL